MLGESAIRGVKDDVQFVGAGEGGFRAEFAEAAEKGFRIVNLELDFRFAGHVKKSTGMKDEEKGRGRVALRGGEEGIV